MFDLVGGWEYLRCMSCTAKLAEVAARDRICLVSENEAAVVALYGSSQRGSSGTGPPELKCDPDRVCNFICALGHAIVIWVLGETRRISSKPSSWVAEWVSKHRQVLEVGVV